MASTTALKACVEPRSCNFYIRTSKKKNEKKITCTNTTSYFSSPGTAEMSTRSLAVLPAISALQRYDNSLLVFTLENTASALLKAAWRMVAVSVMGLELFDVMISPLKLNRFANHDFFGVEWPLATEGEPGSPASTDARSCWRWNRGDPICCDPSVLPVAGMSMAPGLRLSFGLTAATISDLPPSEPARVLTGLLWSDEAEVRRPSSPVGLVGGDDMLLLLLLEWLLLWTGMLLALELLLSGDETYLSMEDAMIGLAMGEGVVYAVMASDEDDADVAADVGTERPPGNDMRFASSRCPLAEEDRRRGPSVKGFLFCFLFSVVRFSFPVWIIRGSSLKPPSLSLSPPFSKYSFLRSQSSR